MLSSLYIVVILSSVSLSFLLPAPQHVSHSPPQADPVDSKHSQQRKFLLSRWSVSQWGEFCYLICFNLLQAQLLSLQAALCSSDSSRSPSPVARQVESPPDHPSGSSALHGPLPASGAVVRALQTLVNAQAAEISRQESQVTLTGNNSIWLL